MVWLAGTGSVALAAGGTADLERILQTRLPTLNIVDIRPSPVPDWFEVYTGDRVLYVDRSGEHVFVGQLVDSRTRSDLTAAALNARQAVDFSTLPLEDAIKTVHGNGQRRIAVFADPDCPYCQRFEKDLAGATDLTVFTFLYPLTDLHPDARKRARAIWCAKDRSAAWRDWMLERKLPADDKCPDQVIDKIIAYGDSLHLTGTPTIFLEDGRRHSGLPSHDQLAQLLGQGASALAPGRTPAAAQPAPASAADVTAAGPASAAPPARSSSVVGPPANSGT